VKFQIAFITTSELHKAFSPTILTTTGSALLSINLNTLRLLLADGLAIAIEHLS